MSADAYVDPDDSTPPEDADFTLDPISVANGRKAATSYLDSLKPGEARRSAEDALHTLALVMSAGVCDAYQFPWQQLRAFHGAAALNMLRAPKSPALVERYRAQRDPTRKYRQVPERYAPKHVQKLRNSLRRVLRECFRLGYLSEEEFARASALPKVDDTAARARGRVLSESELRALISVCNRDSSPLGYRDALLFYLAYECGLMLNELLRVTLDDLGFDPAEQQATLRVRAKKGGRDRTVPLRNEALIALEDWLELRGDEDGPLLCPVRRGGGIEIRRLTATAVRQECRRRAQLAGVEAFSPNDLRRQNGHATADGFRRIHSQPTSRALFGEEDARQAEWLRFPYPGRSLRPI